MWSVNPRALTKACLLLVAVAGCSADTHVAPDEIGYRLVDLYFYDLVGPHVFTAPVPLPDTDPSIAPPVVTVDSAPGPRYGFLVNVNSDQYAEALLVLPQRSARYLGLKVTPPFGQTAQWGLNIYREPGKTERSATMQVAIVRGGKMSPPVTIPVPFY